LQWLDLFRFGKGLILALCVVFIRAFSQFIASDHLSLFITSVGIIIFLVGIYIALFGMHNHYKEFEKIQLRTREKE